MPKISSVSLSLSFARAGAGAAPLAAAAAAAGHDSASSRPPYGAAGEAAVTHIEQRIKRARPNRLARSPETHAMGCSRTLTAPTPPSLALSNVNVCQEEIDDGPPCGCTREGCVVHAVRPIAVEQGTNPRPWGFYAFANLHGPPYAAGLVERQSGRPSSSESSCRFVCACH
jgi:hypothetical protein